MNDRYWRSMLFIFGQNAKLSSLLTTKYFDMQNGVVKIDKLKRESKPWAESEKFMLHLALHLYSERNKVNLSDMDYLDANNKKIALKAIQIRFA